MGKQIRTTIYIDEDIWEMLKIKLPCSRSEFFEKQARTYLFGKNQLDKLIEEKKQLELNLNSVEMEIEKMEKIQKKNDNDPILKSKAMSILRNIANNHNGCISETNVKFVANNHGISIDVLLDEIKHSELKINNELLENETKTHNERYLKPY